MTDDELERRVRAALEQDAAGPAPARLRAQLATIPSTAANGQHRLTVPWRLVTATAAAVVVVAAVAGTARPEQGRHPAASMRTSGAPSVVPSPGSPGPSTPGQGTASPTASTSPAPRASALTWARVPDDGRLRRLVTHVVVAAAPGGGFLAIASGDLSDPPSVMSSANGTTWTSIGTLIPGGSGASVSGLAAGSDALVAAGVAGTDPGASSSIWLSEADGRKWIPVHEVPGDMLRFGHVASKGGSFVAVRGDASATPLLAYESANGRDWITVTILPPGPGIAQVSDVTSAGSGFVAVGGVDGAAAAWTSAFGIEWAPATVGDPPEGPFSAVAARGDRVVALGPVRLSGDDPAEAPTGVAAWVSADGGASWARAAAVPGLLGPASPIALALPDRFVASGQAADRVGAWSSLDGTRWDRDRMVGSDPAWGITDDWIDGVTFAGRRAVLAGHLVGTGAGGPAPVFWTADLPAP